MYNLIIKLIKSIIIGYLFGSIPVGVLYCKAHNVDIMNKGSKNPGSTNVGRVLGKFHGRVVFILDILKTWIAIFISELLIGNTLEQGYSDYYIIIFYSGFGAILGHNFPLFNKFKGGKGITCSVAAIAYANILYAILLYLLHFIIKKATHYVSVASIIAVSFVFITSIPMCIFRISPYNFEYNFLVLPATFLISFICVIRHKDNIIRLLNGTENKT